MNYIGLGVSVVAYVTSLIIFVYHKYKITVIDAKARGMKHPKLMGILATSGNNGGGSFLYFLRKKKHPIKNITKEEEEEILVRKRIMRKCVIVSIIGIVCFIYFIKRI